MEKISYLKFIKYLSKKNFKKDEKLFKLEEKKGWKMRYSASYIREKNVQLRYLKKKNKIIWRSHLKIFFSPFLTGFSLHFSLQKKKTIKRKGKPRLVGCF